MGDGQFLVALVVLYVFKATSSHQRRSHLMQEHVGRTRLVLRNGTNYSVTEDMDDVVALMVDASTVLLTSVTGQQAFPPERLVVKCDEIASVQEISPEGWVWQERATELHYARQLQDLESAPGERLVAAQERLIEVLAGDGDDD